MRSVAASHRAFTHDTENRRITAAIGEMTTSRTACFEYSVLFFAISVTTLADHLPAKLIALGRPETMLAGISIRKPYSSLKDVERTWGPSLTTTGSQDRNPCDRLVSWSLRGVTVTASVGCDPPGNPVVYTIQVSGTDPARKFAAGFGLSLGDPLEKVYSIYGRRLRLSSGPEGCEITIQWENGTELNATVSPDNRVVRIQLLPQVE